MKSSHALARIARDAGLPRTEAALFAYVAYWSPKASYQHEGSLWTYTVREDLQSELGVSERTVDRALKAVEARGLIVRQASYNARARRHVTLLRLTPSGQRLAASETRQASGEVKPDCQEVGMRSAELALENTEDCRRPCRQSDAIHSSDVPSPVSLEVSSAKAAGKKGSLQQKESENECSSEHLVTEINLLLEKKGLPLWKKDQWALKHASDCLEKIGQMQITLADFIQRLDLLLEDWGSALRELPRAFVQYEDNAHRPSPKCLSSMFAKLLAITAHRLSACAALDELERRIAEKDLESRLNVKTALAHLLDGRWPNDCHERFSEEVWRLAHEEALGHDGYLDRYRERMEGERQSRLMQLIPETISRGNSIPAFQPSDLPVVLKAVDAFMQEWTDNFADGWEKEYGLHKHVRAFAEEHGLTFEARYE